MSMEPAKLKFPKCRRLGGRTEFSAIRAAGPSRWRGPLGFRILPNSLAYTRIGISIGRHVGSAVRRNRIKRLIREAFRLEQHRLPAGLDVLISVRKHEPMGLEQYQGILRDSLKSCA